MRFHIINGYVVRVCGTYVCELHDADTRCVNHQWSNNYKIKWNEALNSQSLPPVITSSCKAVLLILSEKRHPLGTKRDREKLSTCLFQKQRNMPKLPAASKIQFQSSHSRTMWDESPLCHDREIAQRQSVSGSREDITAPNCSGGGGKTGNYWHQKTYVCWFHVCLPSTQMLHPGA